jgi:hypothetical protein
MSEFSAVRRTAARRPVIASLVAAAVGATILFAPGVGGMAGAAKPHDGGPSVPAPPAAPTSADQIQNIDQVKTAIKAYYGDTLAGKVDPVPNTVDGADKPIHTFSDTSAYANEVGGIVQDAQEYLGATRSQKHLSGQKAVLFDVDDTTLNTYDYEIYSNFVYNPATNAAFVDNPNYTLRAVPHMVELENWAAAQGYTVFFLTGRGIAQLGGTIEDLRANGYTFDDANVYTKDLNAPWLASCGHSTPPCTTIQYKSLTRAHIESLGYDIVANFGDQYSDLTGGYADETFKMPNPMYYLP